MKYNVSIKNNYFNMSNNHNYNQEIIAEKNRKNIIQIKVMFFLILGLMLVAFFPFLKKQVLAFTTVTAGDTLTAAMWNGLETELGCQWLYNDENSPNKLTLEDVVNSNVTGACYWLDRYDGDPSAIGKFGSLVSGAGTDYLIDEIGCDHSDTPWELSFYYRVCSGN